MAAKQLIQKFNLVPFHKSQVVVQTKAAVFSQP